MPSLLNPIYPPLIRALPVAYHSFEVDALFWQPLFDAAGHNGLWQAIFGNQPAIRISRHRLLTCVYPTQEQKCVEILLWGYPRNQRGRVSQLLPRLAQLAAAGGAQMNWQDYFAQFIPIPGIGISTVTKLAHFYGLTFDGYPALILDMQIMAKIQRWPEVHMPGLRYDNAPQQYVDHLRAMHAAALQIGCSEAQLELFLFTFGSTMGIDL